MKPHLQRKKKQCHRTKFLGQDSRDLSNHSQMAWALRRWTKEQAKLRPLENLILKGGKHFLARWFLSLRALTRMPLSLLLCVHSSCRTQLCRECPKSSPSDILTRFTMHLTWFWTMSRWYVPNLQLTLHRSWRFGTYRRDISSSHLIGNLACVCYFFMKTFSCEHQNGVICSA